MRLIKNIAGRFFALWAAFLFIGSLLIVVLPVWLLGLVKEPKRTAWVFRALSIWMDFFFIFSGVRRVFRGKEHFKKGRNYVVVCNHNSFMDVPLSSTGIPGPNKTIAKVSMAKIPVFGLIYKRGSVLVDRKSEKSRRSSYGKMKEVLSLGLHMCIYPEGTRNQTSEPLQRFHDGAFRLAVETGKSVIPTLIFNSNKVLPRKPFYFWPYKVEMHFLPEVPAVGKTVTGLKDEVFGIMKKYYESNRVN